MTDPSPPINRQTGESVELIDLAVSENMIKAAQAVVRNKFVLDEAVEDFGASMLARDLHDGAYGPAEPLPFLHRVVPFAYTMERVSGPRPARVPTANTIGCSWKWRSRRMKSAQKAKCRTDLDNDTALLDGTLDDASYAWIKPLGIIAPGEGKNRAGFFRSEGIESIPANVSEWTYADPSRIALYVVKDSAFEATWAVLDGRWVEAVAHPSWTKPLMTAYGVATDKLWPDDFPAPAEVLMAFFDSPRVNSPLGDPEHRYATVIDLATMTAIAEFQEERESTTVHGLKAVQIDCRVWQFAIAGFLAAIMLLALLPQDWTEAQVITGILLGAAGCAGMLPYLMNIVTVPRGGLSKEQYLPRERSPKNCGQGPRLLG